MVSSALLFALALQNPTLIDFEVRATSLYNALGKLSRQTGRTYAVAPELQGEIVCIRVNGVSLDDLTKKIAETVTATWVPEGEKMVLRRTSEQIKADEEKILAGRRKHLRVLFDAKAKELANLETPHAQAQHFLKAIKTLNDKIAENPRGISLDGPRLAAPISTLANLLAIDLGPDVIAAVPPMQTRTFTLTPNRAQYQLGPKAKQIIQNYEAAESNLTSLVGDEKPNTKGMMEGLLDDIFDRKATSEPIGKVLLTVSNRGRITSFNASVYNRSGKFRAWGLAGSYRMGDDPWKEEREAGAGKSPKNIRLSEASREFADVAEPEPNYSSFPGSGPLRKWTDLPESAKKILLNPETIDPLALATTDACMEFSGNLVAYLGDASGEASRLAINKGELDLTRFRALLPVQGHKLKEEGGWTTIQPNYPTSVTTYRMNRGAMGRFLKKVAAQGMIDLQTYCRYNFEAGNPIQFSAIERTYRKTIENYGIRKMPDQESHAHGTFAALGSLNPTQWKNLYAGNAIRFGQLPQQQRLLGERWITQWAIYLKTDPAAQITDLMKVPTEYAQNGLPADSLLTCQVGSKRVMRGYSRIKDMDGREFMGSIEQAGRSPAELASGFAKGGYYKSLEHLKREVENAQYEVSERTDVVFTIRFLGVFWIEEKFQGPAIDPKIVKFSQLPDDMKREFFETFERTLREKQSGGGN